MATSTVYLSGKAKWAHTGKPDKYDKYSVVLYPDTDSLEKIHELKKTPAILNDLKKDEDGYNIKLSVPPNQNIAGKIVVHKIDVLKPDGMPLTEALIGNGSDITVKCEVYTYRQGKGRAIRPKSIRVDNLVPFTVQNSFAPEDKEEAMKLLEQPAPLF